MPTASFVRADAFSSIRGGRLSSSCAHGIHVSFFSNGCWAEMFSSPHVTSFAAASARHVPYAAQYFRSLADIIDEAKRHCQGESALFARFFQQIGQKHLLISTIFFAKISSLYCGKYCEKKVYNFLTACFIAFTLSS